MFKIMFFFKNNVFFLIIFIHFIGVQSVFFLLLKVNNVQNNGLNIILFKNNVHTFYRPTIGVSLLLKANNV